MYHLFYCHTNPYIRIIVQLRFQDAALQIRFNYCEEGTRETASKYMHIYIYIFLLLLIYYIHKYIEQAEQVVPKGAEGCRTSWYQIKSVSFLNKSGQLGNN